MRKILILITISIYSSIDSSSQNYKPFNFENGEWVCYYYTKGGIFDTYGNVYVHERVKYYCQGDTLISDTLYKKMYYVGYAQPYLQPPHDISGYYAAVRNDTINKKVLIKSDHIFDFAVTDLLYDFNINIGDPCQYCCQDTSVITVIDSVLYCDSYHKRYRFTDALNNTYSIIEGIGSTFGLTPRHCGVNSSWLVCYSENDVPACDTCDIPVSIIINNETKFDIFPNPTNDYINIDSEFPVSLLEISDISGRIVYCDINVSRNMTRVSLPYKGIFIVKIRIRDQILTSKVIKI